MQQMEQGGGRNLDFTKQGKLEEQEMLHVEGLGRPLTIREAEALVSPGKIPGSGIEFHEKYSMTDLEKLRDYVEKFKGLFSTKAEAEKYQSFIDEIEKRLLIRKALEGYYKAKEQSKTVH